jgi:Toxin co-regulated pilus biosynthesis protein Q
MLINLKKTVSIKSWLFAFCLLATFAAHSQPIVFGDKDGSQARAIASAPAATPADIKSKKWVVDPKDGTLDNIFRKWAAQAGYSYRWDVDKHIMVDAADVLSGSLEDALNSVLNSSGISSGDTPLEYCIYANTPPLLRVTRKFEQTLCN